MDSDVDWRIVFRILTEHLDDFRDFARQILAQMGASGMNLER